MVRQIFHGKPFQFLTICCLLVVSGCGSSLTPEQGMQRAANYREKGNYRAAVIELKNILISHPDNLSSRLMLGKIYLQQRDGLSANVEFQKIKANSHNLTDLRLLQAKALFLARKYRGILNDISVKKKDSAKLQSKLLLLQAYANFYLQHLQQADQLFQRILTLDKHNTHAFTGQAMVSLEKNHFDDADQQIKLALSSDPNSMEAWIIKAQLALAEKQYKPAEKAFQHAIEISKTNHAFTFLAPRQAYIYLVQTYINDNRLRKATQLVDKLAVASPDYPVIHYLRALIAYNLNDFDKASKDIKIIRSIAPDYDPALLLEVAINFSLGNLEQTNKALSDYLIRHPDDTSAQKLLVATRLKLKQPKQAYKLLSPLLKQDPDNLHLLLLASDAMREAGKLPESIPMLKKALTLEPENNKLKIHLASAYLSNKEDDKAIHILKTVPAEKDKFGQRNILLLLAWSHKGDYQSARKLTDDYLKNHHDDATVLSQSGVILMRMGKIKLARNRFEQALIQKPGDLKTIILLTRLEYHAKNYSRAEQLLLKLQQQKPNNASIMYALANINALKGDDRSSVKWLERARNANPDALEPRLVLIRYYLQKNKIHQAFKIGEEAIKIAPRRAGVWNIYATIQNKLGDPAGAIASLHKAIKLQPDASNILMHMAQLHIQSTDYNSAAKSLNKLLLLSPDNFRAASMLAVIKMKQGNKTQAFEIVHQQLTTKNRSAAMVLKGDLYMMEKNYVKAVQAYQAASKNSAAASTTVKYYYAARRAEKSDAENILLSWLKKHPDDHALRFLLAVEYDKNSNIRKAIPEYEILARQQPGNANVLNNLAHDYSLQKDKRALSTAEKAYKMNRHNAAIQDTLGWILLNENNTKRALKLLQDAASSLPDNKEVSYHYAVALAKSGDQLAAINILKKLDTTKADDSLSRKVTQYLKILQSFKDTAIR